MPPAAAVADHRHIGIAPSARIKCRARRCEATRRVARAGMPPPIQVHSPGGLPAAIPDFRMVPDASTMAGAVGNSSFREVASQRESLDVDRKAP